MAKKAQPKKNAPSEQAKPIADVLEFLNPILKRDDQNKQSLYCTFADNQVTAFDGILAGGVDFPFDIACAPQLSTFLSALKKCKGEMAIAITEDQQLAVSAGKFNALIPCEPTVNMPKVWPDQAQYPLTDFMYECLEKLVPILADGDSKQWIETCILFKDCSMVATDGKIMAEVWHGFQGVTHNEIYYPLPTVILSSRVVKALLAIRKELYGFGTSENTITFWFKDGSWLRAQKYQETYPDTDVVFSKHPVEVGNPVPEITLAIDAVADFSEDGSVFFGDGALRSGEEYAAASYRLDKLPQGFRFKAKYLKIALNIAATNMGFANSTGLFYGGTKETPIRVLIMGYQVQGQSAPADQQPPPPPVPEPEAEYIPPAFIRNDYVTTDGTETETWDDDGTE